MSYAFHKKLVIGFLIAYFFAGMYAVDTYPFFNWALFTKIPNEQKDYTIEIRSYDGVVYDPPVDFSNSRFLFDAISQSPTQYTQPISELGAAVQRNDVATIEARKSYIEAIFNGKPYTYALIKVTYDPVERWRTKTYKSREEIAVFTSDHAK